MLAEYMPPILASKLRHSRRIFVLKQNLRSTRGFFLRFLRNSPQLLRYFCGYFPIYQIVTTFAVDSS